MTGGPETLHSSVYVFVFVFRHRFFFRFFYKVENKK